MLTIESIRRVTHDSNHNAFTGAAYFQNALYIAFRQGDSHVDDGGRLIVLRSRDHGKTFDLAHVARGNADTRDAHLYVAGNRLILTGFTLTNAASKQGRSFHSGCVYTENGLNWSQWIPFNGTDNYILWRPEYFNGKHYCSGYAHDTTGNNPDANKITWFESDNGIDWSAKLTLEQGATQPNECSLAFKPDGTAVMLVRREHASKKPLLMTAPAPYTHWIKQELDIRIGGPCLWLAGDDIYFSGRWFISPRNTHVAIWKMEDGAPLMQLVLPSGPGFDCSYMSRAQRPDNRSKFALVYYSGHDLPADPNLHQWEKPSIYLAEAVFTPNNFITRWQYSDVQPHASLNSLPEPSAADPKLAWQPIQSAGADSPEFGFINAHSRIDKRPGIIYFTTDANVGPTDTCLLHLGYDGPIKAWLNGIPVAEAQGKNPARPDKTSVKVTTSHGTNHLTIALDTNQGKAWGIYARIDAIS